jgi:hypothetical protein
LKKNLKRNYSATGDAETDTVEETNTESENKVRLNKFLSEAGLPHKQKSDRVFIDRKSNG